MESCFCLRELKSEIRATGTILRYSKRDRVYTIEELEDRWNGFN